MSTDVEKQSPLVNEPHAESTDGEFNQEKSPAPTTERSSLDQPAQNEPAKPVNPWMDPSSFPDGGAQAWLTVAAASALFFVSWG